MLLVLAYNRPICDRPVAGQQVDRSANVGHPLVRPRWHVQARTATINPCRTLSVIHAFDCVGGVGRVDAVRCTLASGARGRRGEG